MKRAFLLAAALAIVIVASCDVTNTSSSPDTGNQNPPDVVTGDDATIPVEDTVDPGTDIGTGGDASEADTYVAPDQGGTGPDYPDEPYGVTTGETIADLQFWASTGTDTINLSDLYGQEKVIVIVSAAGWCEVCQYEAAEINDFYHLYDDKGLILLYTLYEDNRGNAISPTFARSWADDLELDYPIYMDQDFVLEPYYTDAATPLNMVVTTSDMQIRYVEVGYSQFQVLYHAKTYLFAK